MQEGVVLSIYLYVLSGCFSVLSGSLLSGCISVLSGCLCSQEGDEVTVFLDLDLELLSFSVNGERLGEAIQGCPLSSCVSSCARLFNGVVLLVKLFLLVSVNGERLGDPIHVQGN